MVKEEELLPSVHAVDDAEVLQTYLMNVAWSDDSVPETISLKVSQGILSFF